MKRKILLIVGIALITGLVITWINSRPNWDDTGITVGMILIASAIFGWLAGQKPWLIALAVGGWIPLHGIIISHNYGSLIALAPAFIGAYAGYFVKKI